MNGASFSITGIQMRGVVLPATDGFAVERLGDIFIGGRAHEFAAGVLVEFQDALVPWKVQ
jgi:hypothetical protein